MERLLRGKLEGGKFGKVSPIDSRRMRAVKGRGNRTTELSLRLALTRAGVRGWRLHPRGLIGKPDFFFPATQVAVFVDGCFWHGCAKCGHIPKVNRPYWAAKILRNRERDTEKARALRKLGIKVVRFWEHDVQVNLSKCLKAIEAATTKE